MTGPHSAGACLVSSISSCSYPSAPAGAADGRQQLQRERAVGNKVLKKAALRRRILPLDPRFLHERVKKNQTERPALEGTGRLRTVRAY